MAVRTGSRRTLIAVLLAVVPLAQFPIDVFTPAIPQMAAELGASTTAVQNAVTAYMLGMSIALVPIGVLADAVGRRRVLSVCLVVLALSSLAIAAAGGIEILLALRVVQGIGGAACMVVVYAVAADIARGRELTSLSGWLGAAWGLAPVVAPAIGGVLAQAISWRGIFVVVGLLAAFALLLVWRALPETLAPEAATPVRPRAIAAAFGRALRNPVYVGLTAVFAVFASAQLAFGVVSPLIYQLTLGLDPAVYGLLALVVGAANLAGELSTGALSARWGARALGLVGVGAFALGTAVLLTGGLVLGPDLLWLTVGFALALYGCGVLCPLAYGTALGLFDRNLGLVGGMTSALCYLLVAATMSGVSALPDHDQVPIALVYAVCAVVGGILVATLLRPGMRSAH